MSQRGSKLVYVIAGEASGDQLGAWLIQQLRSLYPHAEFCGVGGAAMRAEGQQQLMDAHELAYFGVTEVLYNLRNIYGQRQKILTDIYTHKPQVLITIDLPDFNFSIGRIAKRMGIPVIHVGAPTVWAWRPKRAQKVSQFLTHLLCLFPFEPQYFVKHGLSAFFVGHPLAHKQLKPMLSKNNKAKQRLLLLPGSRNSEVRRLFPIMLRAAALLKQTMPHLVIETAQLPETFALAQKIGNNFKHVVDVAFVDAEHRHQVMQAATVAIAASGTVTLDLTITQTPMVIVYKLGFWSALVARLLLTTKVVGLPNIILNKPFIPELLQEHCSPERIAKEIQHLLDDAQARDNQIVQLTRVAERLTIQPDILNKTWRKIFDKIL